MIACTTSTQNKMSQIIAGEDKFVFDENNYLYT